MSEFRFEPPVPLSQTRWLNLFRTQWTHGGASGEWVFASRKKAPHAYPIAPDAVVIAPILREEGKPNRIMLVKEFRIPLGSWSIGFPAGLIDPGETVESTIARELREEVGLELVDIAHLSPPIFSSCGMTDEAFVQAYVYARHGNGGASPEPSEAIIPMELDIEGVKSLLEETSAKALPFDAKCWLILDEFRRKGAIAF